MVHLPMGSTNSPQSMSWFYDGQKYSQKSCKEWPDLELVLAPMWQWSLLNHSQTWSSTAKIWSVHGTHSMTAAWGLSQVNHVRIPLEGPDLLQASQWNEWLDFPKEGRDPDTYTSFSESATQEKEQRIWLLTNQELLRSRRLVDNHDLPRHVG